MKLHLLTAVTRPENLPQIEASLAPAADFGIEVVWHTQADPEHQSVGGQSIKNAMIEQIDDGWVYILDDDNLMHPHFWHTVAAAVAARPEAAMLVITQAHRNGWARIAHPAMLRPTLVDAGQVVVRRDALGDLRIPEHYCGDGEWIAALGETLAGRIVFCTTPATYYNWLRAP